MTTTNNDQRREYTYRDTFKIVTWKNEGGRFMWTVYRADGTVLHACAFSDDCLYEDEAMKDAHEYVDNWMAD